MTSPERHRICLTLHYDGAAYFGWQLQPKHASVQGELERVVSKLLDEPVRVTGSGRTDRGVHATGQVATVDAPRRWTPEALRRAMNALLPDEIWVVAARVVDPRFHPRFDARLRSYVYRVGTVELSRSPFHARWCWPLAREVDPALLRECARSIVGENSFRAFAKAGQEERGDRCRVDSAEWREWPGMGVEFHISANRFLHHMVRYLVGTQVEIGLGHRPVSHLAALLENVPGLETSPPAPPEGLYLSSVRYPPPPYGPGEPAVGASGGPLPSSL